MKDSTTFDIGVMAEPLSVGEALREMRSYSVTWKVGFTTLLIVCIVPLLILIILGLAGSPSGGGIFCLILLAGGGAYGLNDLYKELNENALLRRLANRNGMLFRRDFRAQQYPGALFRDMPYIPRAISTGTERFVEIGHIRPQFSQRRSSSAVTYTYVRIKLANHLPRIILKRNALNSLIEGEPDGAKLKLEGGFGDNYTLFVPAGYEQDALYIFTPDVMIRFYDAAPEFDCEIVGDELYFYSAKKIDIVTAQNLAHIADMIAHILAKFDKQSGKYTDNYFRGAVTESQAHPDWFRLRASKVTIAATTAILVLLAVGLLAVFL